MMKIVMNSSSFSTTFRSISPLICFFKRFFANTQKIKLEEGNGILRRKISQRVTAKTKTDLRHTRRTEKLEEKARSLISGEKNYVDLSPSEKKIVDFYQQEKFNEGGIILPNTRAAIEQAEVEQMLRRRQLKIWDKIVENNPETSSPSVQVRKPQKASL